MATVIKKLIDWVVDSSTNPEKLSLTLQGALPLLMLLGIGNTDIWKNISDNVSNIIMLVGQIATAVVTVVGLIRKITNTIKDR